MSSAASSSTAAATAPLAPLQGRFADPDDALVGLDLHEVPVLARHAHEPIANRGDVHPALRESIRELIENGRASGA